MNHEVIRKDWAGQVVDARFRLLEWLGSHGQSGVFLCEVDEDPTQKAAIKLFPADVPGSAACEAGWAVASGLDHPHLLHVLHTGRATIEETDVLYVVTEYAGEVLSEILPERALTPEEVKEMLGPVLDALAYLHDKGLVHGRLKPSNILVVDDQLKLSVENIRGSAAYATPPEVLEIYDPPERAAGRVMSASDLWSLGVTLVEALTRIPPAWSRSSGSEPIVPHTVPSPFAQVARQCLRLDPALRCTLGEIRACLESGTSIPHRSSEPRTKMAPRNNRRVAVLIGAAAVLVAGFTIVMVSSHHAAPSAPAPSIAADQQTQINDETAAESTALPAAPAPKTATAKPKASAPQNQASISEKQAPQRVQTETPQSKPRGPAGKGAVTEQVLPKVPQAASQTISGTVNVGVQVMVDSNGAVSDAAIASQGPSKYFANLALSAAHLWKFSPPQVNGQGVPSTWLLEFHFRQAGTEVTPTEQVP